MREILPLSQWTRGYFRVNKCWEKRGQPWSLSKFDHQDSHNCNYNRNYNYSGINTVNSRVCIFVSLFLSKSSGPGNRTFHFDCFMAWVVRNCDGWVLWGIMVAPFVSRLILGPSTTKFQKYSDTLAPRHVTKYELAVSWRQGVRILKNWVVQHWSALPQLTVNTLYSSTYQCKSILIGRIPRC